MNEPLGAGLIIVAFLVLWVLFMRHIYRQPEYIRDRNPLSKLLPMFFTDSYTRRVALIVGPLGTIVLLFELVEIVLYKTI